MKKYKEDIKNFASKCAACNYHFNLFDYNVHCFECSDKIKKAEFKRGARAACKLLRDVFEEDKILLQIYSIEDFIDQIE